ncbi:hypothetical protein NW768_002163 [Fusarium equiseti]|uniref:RRM domain-containing protein n=1 Tax=Fusarium equiseti TaxID=61235 RepID=A0ABQ8RMN8_FUSEQ|nr:hypothetical protein NW768_002163 [Fusarium equiseti]
MCSPASPPVLNSDEMIFLKENQDEFKRLEGLCEDQKQELQDLKGEIDEAVLKGRDVTHETAQMSQLSRTIDRNTARLSVLHEQIVTLGGKQEFVEPTQYLENESVEEPPQGVGLQSNFPSGPQECEWGIKPKPSPYPESRRVVLTGLPGSTSVIQVADAVQGLGGLASIFLNPQPSSRATPGEMTAMVEFNDPLAAVEYVEQVNENGLWFVDVEDLHHKINVELVKTTSNRPTRDHPRQFGVPNSVPDVDHSGRSIVVPNFPEQAIWALFKKFGVKHIIRADYDRDEEALGGKLNIEFTNLFQSTRFVRFIIQGDFGLYRTSSYLLRLGTTPSDNPTSELHERMHTVDHVDPLELELLWNRPRYNMFKERTQTMHSGAPILRRPLQSNTTGSAPSTVIQLIELFEDQIKTRRVSRTMINASLRMNLTEYILVDVTIYSSHNPVSNIYVRPQGLELSYFKYRTVLDEQYANFWNVFTQRTGFDIRRFYAYAEVAAHRREENQRLGRPAWDAGDILRITAPNQDIYSYAHPYLTQDVIDTSN